MKTQSPELILQDNSSKDNFCFNQGIDDDDDLVFYIPFNII